MIYAPLHYVHWKQRAASKLSGLLGACYSFDISVDQFFYPLKDAEKTTLRRQLDSQLDKLDETDLIIVAATITEIQEAKEAKE